MTVAHPAAAYVPFNKKTNKLIKLVFTCSITEDFAQVGGGKPDKANKGAIQDVATRSKAHEDKHKVGYVPLLSKSSMPTGPPRT